MLIQNNHALQITLLGGKLQNLIQHRHAELEGEIVLAVNRETIGGRSRWNDSERLGRQRQALAMISDLLQPNESYTLSLPDLVLLDMIPQFC
jgi:hypothetical protein